MDRLHALIIITALCGAACNGEPPKPPPSATRVEAVTAKGPDDNAVAGFCDIHAKPGAGEAFALPPVSAPPKEKSGGAQWVNVWATWCKPCVEELPMMQAWGPRLSGDGAPTAMHYVNVDAEASSVEQFRADHPGTPESLRIASPEALAPWMEGLGLDPGAGLPIHAFVGKDGRTRCVRSGAVTEDHYALVKTLLR
ncbi:MAG: TlpA disulfide reductase family protein [Myxococcales bacterium]|nr:TlpA disulfide reductase family protein [Myxococcales bacterium]